MAGVVIVVLLGKSLATMRRDAGTTRTYATTTGETAVLQLVDGTRVTMAPRTTLRLVHFGAGARTVLLDGEAFFEVSRSPGAPFMVQTGTVVTRVLGTAFLVRHYPADQRVRVAVATGKVAVASQASSRPTVTLTAGHVAEVTDSTALVKTVESAGSEIQWASDELAFHRIPVSEVLATLSRWYGYEFRVTDSALMQQKVTIWLSTRSSTKALSTLRSLLNVNLTVTGDTVTLTPRHTRQTMEKQRRESYEAFVPSRGVGR